MRTAPASNTLRRPLPSLLDRAHAFHFPLSPRWHAALAPDRLAHVRDPRPRRRTGGLRCTVHLLIRTVPLVRALDSRSVTAICTFIWVESPRPARRLRAAIRSRPLNRYPIASYQSNYRVRGGAAARGRAGRRALITRAGDTHGKHTGHTGAHGHTDRTDEPSSQPSLPTNAPTRSTARRPKPVPVDPKRVRARARKHSRVCTRLARTDDVNVGGGATHVASKCPAGHCRCEQLGPTECHDYINSSPKGCIPCNTFGQSITHGKRDCGAGRR